MILLILGLLIWCGVHLIPSLAVSFRSRLIGDWGEKKYKMVFALCIVLSIVLMVLGWRATVPVSVYTPPAWGRHLTGLLVLVAFLLIAAAKSATNIKRYIRHPQLIGILFWSVGHLLANGDIRSLILFAVLGIWAGVEMICINKREGTWIKQEPLPLSAELVVLLKGVAVYLVFLLLHPYLFGVKPW